MALQSSQKQKYSEKISKKTKKIQFFLSTLRLWQKNSLILISLKLNTRYMTNSTLVSPVKMEYGWNFSISGLKMVMKSGLGKIFLKFLYALTMLFLLLNLHFWSKFSDKNDMVNTWRNFKNIFLDHFSSSFLGQKC